MFLADIAIGLFVATITSIIFGFEPRYGLIVAGIAGAILPDWDMILHLLAGGRLDEHAHEHRDISHHPLIMVPTITYFMYNFYGYEHALIMGISMICHYLADSFSIGWGIQWLYPFSDCYFLYKRVSDEATYFHIWTPRNQEQAARAFGDPSWATRKQSWLRDAVLLVISSMIAYGWLMSRR